MTELAKQPQPIGFNELLHYVTEGTLAEVPVPDIIASPDDTSVTRPEDLWRWPGVEGVHDPRESLRPGFKGWEPGTTVRGTYTVAIELYTKKVILQAETYRMDWMDRQVDSTHATLATFTLGDQNSFGPQEQEAILNLGLTRFVADATIHGPAHTPDSLERYNASIEAIHAVQLPFDGNETALQEGQPVLIEGTVVDMRFNSNYANRTFLREDPNNPHIAVNLSNGQVGTVYPGNHPDIHYGSSSVVAASGAQDLTPARPLPGDVVQIAATCRKQSPGLAYPPPAIFTHRRTDIHLLKAGDARLMSEFQAGNELIHFLGEIEGAKNPVVVRDLLATFMN